MLQPAQKGAAVCRDRWQSIRSAALIELSGRMLPGRQKVVSATKVGVKITDAGFNRDMLKQDEFIPASPVFRLLCYENSRSWDVPSSLLSPNK